MDDLLHLVGASKAAAVHTSSSTQPDADSDADAHHPPSPTSAARARSPIVQILQRGVKVARDCQHAILHPFDRPLERRRWELEERMRTAETLSQWEETALALDELDGNHAWKNDLSTGECNARLILSRCKQLDAARANCDLREVLPLLRHTLHRDVGGMGNARLYRHSHTGTKKIIERYVETAVATIDDVVQRSAKPSTRSGMPVREILGELTELRQNFGRSALMLSGGAVFGMTHIGVVKCLFEQKLLPRIISGASAGSIVCSVLCVHTDDEIPGILETFPHGDLAVFAPPGGEPGGIAGSMRKLLTKGSWADVSNLKRVMRNILGDITFREAYNRTRRICNITVSSATTFELPRLLNYHTAPEVIIWSAVAVSCSVPLLFEASQLLVKDPLTGEHVPWDPSPQRWIDGSVDNDLPTERLAEMFSVNHFIVSQVNPHVVPFLTREDTYVTPEERRRMSLNDHYKIPQVREENVAGVLMSLARDEALHRLTFAAEMGVFPNLLTKLCSIISQTYSGDITIIPEIDFKDLPSLISNPTSEFMIKSMLIGEKATWPKLRRIRDHCAIELAIDRAIHELQTHAAFSPSQVNLRRSMGTRAGEVGQQTTHLHHRQRRRSGGGLQLLVRQRQNRGEVEQIMTDNESRITGDEDSSDDEGGAMLELNMRRAKQRKKSSGSQAANGEAAGSLLKPVLRRATRSHTTLPVSMLAQLRTTAVEPRKAEADILSDPDDHLEIMAMASNITRSGSPWSLRSPTLAGSSAGPSSPHLGVVLPPTSPPMRELTPSKEVSSRVEVMSPTTMGDSSVFDADVDSLSGKSSSSEPELKSPVPAEVAEMKQETAH